MKKFIVLTALVLSLFVYFTVFATSPSVPTCTVHFWRAPGLAAGDAVVEGGTRIGSVTEVEPRPDGGIDAQIRLDPRFRDRLRQRSTLLITRLPDYARPVLSLHVLDEESPPLPSGERLEGADSEAELAVRREMVKAEKALREVARHVDDFQRTVEGVRKSEERKELENSVSGLLGALRHVREEAERIIAEELSKMKEWYGKLVS